VPRRRIAVLGDDDAVARVAPVLEEIPELELVRLRRSPSIDPQGYAEAPDARSYLFDGAPAGRLGFAATALLRSWRLRMGASPAFVDALGNCELLVVAGHDGPQERRERWAAKVVIRTARARGVSVAETDDPTEIVALLQT